MTSSLLVAAGDKWGAIGLWNVNDTTSEKHGVEVFYVSKTRLVETSFKIAVSYYLLVCLCSNILSLTAKLMAF
jgi:hypothetical protein